MNGSSSLTQVWVSIGAFVGGAVAYLLSPLITIGLLTIGAIFLGTWLGSYLTNREYRQRLIGGLVAELSYNKGAVKDIIDHAERGQLKDAVAMPHLRTSALSEASGNTQLLGLADRDSDILVATLRAADLVNEGLAARERFQLIITTARDQFMVTAQTATREFARTYQSAELVLAELVRALRSGKYRPNPTQPSPEASKARE